jgi:hypothetical protein
MRIVELLLDEESLQAGIQAISVVESPAIEEDFVALKDEQPKIELKTIDKEKRILMGAALIPNKPIYRRSGEDEYYIYFSQDTVRKASELFFINGNQNKATLEHQIDITGLSVVESWIIEGEQDKSKLYGMDLPVGTWMVSMKILNDELWEGYVKSGKVKGFSIEGYFVDKVEASKHEEIDADELEAEKKLKEIEDVILSALGSVKLGSEKELSQVSNKMSTLISNMGKSISQGEKVVDSLSFAKKVINELDSYQRDVTSLMSESIKTMRAYEQKAKELGVSVGLSDNYTKAEELLNELDSKAQDVRMVLDKLEKGI